LGTHRILTAMSLRRVALLATLATAAVFGVPAAAEAATTTSSNWAGYAVSQPDVKFRRVSATWVVSAATCSATGSRHYSAAWLGLGGYHASSTALEQIGTETDCTAKGTPSYSAWYELVPSAPVDIDLTVKPGDTVSASVTVSGHTVKLFLANRTRGTVFTKQLTADRIDITSAEWIVEAPSACYGDRCETLPLANFGTTAFANARATKATTGHQGAINDPAWTATSIALRSGGRHAFGGGRFAVDDSSGAATPGDLSATGDGFAVTYEQQTDQTQPDPYGPPSPSI
jgi:Peptidase A4 family